MMKARFCAFGTSPDFCACIEPADEYNGMRAANGIERSTTENERISRMSRNKVVKSTCVGCFSGCGMLVHVEDGKIVKVEGDPDAPINKGILCPKGEASLELLYHPERLKHPLKRAGERGEGKWQQISWDEALSTVADAMTKAKQNYGAESVAFFRGAAKGIQDGVMTRLASTFGTPNVTSQAFVCFHPARNAAMITLGVSLGVDYEYPPGCIVIWGSNPPDTNRPPCVKITEAMSKGSKLMVIDPRRTELAEKADLWLRLRPGSDLALALGMINVIVNENLFDESFVAHWTVGFDELKSHIQDYSPEQVAEITWLPAEVIREAARFYIANRPAAISSGNALEQNVNSFQTDRAILILEAISGNVGVPGGKILWSVPPVQTRGAPELTLRGKIAKEIMAQRLGADRLSPLANWALPQSIQKALLATDSPPIRAAYVHGGSLLLTWANAQDTYQAFERLDFLAAADLFMTPTAMLADVVLPVASYLEYDDVRQTEAFPGAVQIGQKVAQIGECWPDSKILIELAKRLGLREYFWDSYEEFLDALLRPAGITFEEFRKIGMMMGAQQYRHYERGGFDTPSGKVEIYSDRLKGWGFPPLPVYRELPETPYSDPDLAKEYPLIFTTRKSGAFTHSQHRQIASLRALHPEPLLSIHAETAAKSGITEGDMVYVETKRGRIKQKATLVDTLDPRVVVVDHDWWFPEKGAAELYGWAEANTNILTDNNPPFNPEMGSTNLRGILCRVYKVC